MTDIAWLPFGGSDQTETQGTLVLSDDGTVRIEASPAMRDALAAREEAALARAERYGTGLGLALIGLGLAAVAGGWTAGRVWGKSASRLLWRRPVQAVTLRQAAEGQLTITLGQTSWDAGSCSPEAAENFQRQLEEIKGDA